MYSLHRSARSRGLQAKGERELVPGLGRVSCGASETLLSSGWNVCVCVCYPVFPPFKWPKSSPFIVEGRTRTVHVSLCGVVLIGVARPNPVACPCGGVVVGVIRPWNTGAAWLSHQILCVVGALGMPRSGRGGERASHYGRTVREAETWSVPRLVLRWGGLGRLEPQDRRDPGIQCRGLKRAADHGYSVRTQWPITPVVPCPSRYGADRGHSGRTQWPVIPVVPCPGRYGADRGHSGRTQWPVTPSYPVPTGMALMRPRVASVILWR